MNIGAFHYFDLFQGTFSDFMWYSTLMIAAVYNLFAGNLTDWIAGMLIYVGFKIGNKKTIE